MCSWIMMIGMRMAGSECEKLQVATFSSHWGKNPQDSVIPKLCPTLFHEKLEIQELAQFFHNVESVHYIYSIAQWRSSRAQLKLFVRKTQTLVYTCILWEKEIFHAKIPHLNCWWEYGEINSAFVIQVYLSQRNVSTNETRKKTFISICHAFGISKE